MFQPPFPERFENLANAPVDLRNDIGKQTFARCPFKLLRGEQWHMRHTVGNIQKEGLSLVPFDEIDGMFRRPSRQIPLL